MSLFDENDDDESLKKMQDRQVQAELFKGVLGGMGGALQAEADVPSAYEYITGKKVGKPTDFAGTFDKMAGSVSDPMENAKKAQEYIRQKRQGRAEARQEQVAESEMDPNSADSIAMQEQIIGVFPQFKQYIQGKSKAQIKELMPILTQKVRGDEDRALRAQEMQMRAADRQDTRADRKLREEEARNNRALKQQELSSTQAKQRGLYEMGKKAEEQFANAIGDGKEHDPTSVGQIIDNSEWAPNWMKNNKAVESQAAMSAWVEGFLRDASGAAIPPSERMSYAKDFFPMPGDSKEVVANKAALRAQKMENARVAAGVGTGHGPADTPMQTAGSKPTPQQLALQEIAKRKLLKNTAGR